MHAFACKRNPGFTFVNTLMFQWNCSFCFVAILRRDSFHEVTIQWNLKLFSNLIVENYEPGAGETDSFLKWPLFFGPFLSFFFLLISLHGLIKIIFLINWYTLEIFHVWIVYCKFKILAEVWLTFAKEYNKIQPNLRRYYISTVKWGSSIPLCKCMLYHYVD